MGWNTIRTPVAKKKGLASMTVSKQGRVVISLPSNVLGIWDKEEAFIAQLGDDEHIGKLMISPAPEGATEIFGRASFQTHSIFRIKGWNAGTREPRSKVTQVDFAIDGAAVIISMPEWAWGEAEAAPVTREWTKPASHKKKAEKPREEGGADKAETISPGASVSPAAGPHQARQVTRNGAAIGHQPNAVQLREADRQTLEARKLPPSVPSKTEPPPSWRDKPVNGKAPKPVVNGKVNLIGTTLEAGGKVISLKGVEERKVATLLVQQMDRRHTTEFDVDIDLPLDGIVRSLNAKLLERKVPLVISKEHNGFRLKWREL